MITFIVAVALIYVGVTLIEQVLDKRAAKRATPVYLLRHPAQAKHVLSIYCQPSLAWQEVPEMLAARRQAAVMLRAIKGKGAPKA